MKWNEALIIRAISIQVLQRKCLLVVDRCVWTGAECDVLGVTENLRIIDIEVKISRADLKADAHKDKWWTRYVSDWKEHTCLPAPKRWPRWVWKHYYAMPAEVWKPELVEALPSPNSGVILLRPDDMNRVPVIASVERRAVPNKDAKKLSAEQAIDIARLANIRMWEAYKRVERLASEATA